MTQSSSTEILRKVTVEEHGVPENNRHSGQRCGRLRDDVVRVLKLRSLTDGRFCLVVSKINNPGRKSSATGAARIVAGSMTRWKRRAY